MTKQINQYAWCCKHGFLFKKIRPVYFFYPAYFPRLSFQILRCFISRAFHPCFRIHTSYYLRFVEFRKNLCLPSRNQVNSALMEGARKTLISRPSIIHIAAFTLTYIYTCIHTYSYKSTRARPHIVKVTGWTLRSRKKYKSVRAEM